MVRFAIVSILNSMWFQGEKFEMDTDFLDNSLIVKALVDSQLRELVEVIIMSDCRLVGLGQIHVIKSMLNVHQVFVHNFVQVKKYANILNATLKAKYLEQYLAVNLKTDRNFPPMLYIRRVPDLNVPLHLPSDDCNPEYLT